MSERLTFSRVAVLLFFSFVSACSYATSCAPAWFTPEEAYDQADAVVLMQATGCDGRDVPVDGLCSSNKYSLDTLEVLKDASPARDYGVVLESAGPMGCGLYFAIGRQYLMYLNADNLPIYGAGGFVEGRVLDELAILREYRDGRVSDLSPPWDFMDSGIHCWVNHRTKELSVGITFAYAPVQRSVSLKTTKMPDGRYRIRADPNAPAIERDLVNPTKREGPELSPGAVAISFTIGDGTSRLESGTVTIGEQTWALQTQFSVYDSGAGERTSAALVAVGENAAEIVAALEPPGRVVVNAVKALPPITFTPDVPEDRAVQAETRTTQFAKTARALTGCIDGSTRDPEPAFN